MATLGIGVGVDYALYIAAGVKERYGIDMRTALEQSLLTAGRGVLITGATMIMSVLAWYASSLKFQADMGLLITLWLTVSAISSLLLIPSMIWVCKPGFIFERRADAPEGQPAVA